MGFGTTKTEAIVFYFRGEETAIEGWRAQAASVGQTIEPGSAF
jgi:hypothetical protein